MVDFKMLETLSWGLNLRAFAAPPKKVHHHEPAHLDAGSSS